MSPRVASARCPRWGTPSISIRSGAPTGAACISCRIAAASPTCTGSRSRTARAGGTLRALPAQAGVLPPANRPASKLVAALADARTGLPAETDFPAAPYRARFSLHFIAQPSLAIAADRFGTYIGGGATLYWCDILGDHNLITMTQVSGQFGDVNVAAVLAYENRKSRWNWGGVVQQVPYILGGIRAGTGTVHGQPA